MVRHSPNDPGYMAQRRHPVRNGRVLLAPDAFKGSASAREIATAGVDAAIASGWDAEACPLSDGGEGFADVLGVVGGDIVESVVTGPSGRPVTARWRLAGDIAVIESAEASGLALAGGADHNDAVAATSRGTGELVVEALRAGARKILVGVGGSACTDGGEGAVAAIEQAGGLQGSEVVVACDVETRFLDAPAMFAPQKGATAEQVIELQSRLERLLRRYRRIYGVDIAVMTGSGAAGGMAGGLAALGAELVAGFDLVSRLVGLRDRLAVADVVITGEGRLDATSWTGKVVGGVVRLAGEIGVPVLIVAGQIAISKSAGWRGDLPGRVCLLGLADACGLDTAMTQPAWCVAQLVEEWLRAQRRE